MPRSEYNAEILNPVNKVNSKDPAFLEIQQKIQDYYFRNEEYYDAMETGKNAKGESILKFEENRLNIVRNINLRNDINNYLETNKSKMTSVEYQSVVQSYENLVKKFDDDFKDLEGGKIFEALDEDMKAQINNPPADINAEKASKMIATRYYLASIKREYNAADKASKKGTEEEKQAAAKWKENVLKKLYSGTFDKDVDNFIKDDVIGKTVYDYCKKRITYDMASTGFDFRSMKNFNAIISSELFKQAIGKIEQARKLEINGDADKQTALDLLAEAERIREVNNLTVGVSSNNKIEVDTSMVKFNKNLFGSFNDKFAEVKQRMYDKYNEQIKADLNSQLDEHNKRIEELKKSQIGANREYRDAKVALEKQEKIFARVKANYEKMKKIGFIDEDDRKVNEGVYERESKILKDLNDKYGDITSRASRIGMEIDRLTEEKRVMQEQIDKVYQEKIKDNPYEPKNNRYEERRLTKSVQRKLSDGTVLTSEELLSPVEVKTGRLKEIFGCMKVMSPNELVELIKIEDENFNLLEQVHKDIDVQNTVGDIIEPGALALAERNRQLNQGEVEAAPEERAPEENKVEEAAPEEEVAVEEENELQDEPLDIDMDSLQTEKVTDLKQEVDAHSQEDIHKGLVSLGAGVASLKAADKGVWGGSKEYDNIIESLKAIQDLEEYQDKNADTFEPSDINARMTTLLAAKKQLAVQMKHYLSRKNEEKEAAEARGKAENQNSAFRRETMENVMGLLEEHIQADEESMGIDKRDKIYEDMSYELRYLADKYKKEPRLKSLANTFDRIESDIPENIPAEDLLRRTQECLNYMISTISRTKDENVKKEMKELVNKLGDHFVKNIAEYKPEALEGIKESFNKNNELLGTSVNTSPKPLTETFNSYDDVKAYNQRQMQDGIKKIFKEETGKKNFINDWALFEDANKEVSYEFALSDAEKNIEKNITTSALKCVFADEQQKGSVIFDPNTINAKSDAFVNEMKQFKTFNNRFRKRLCENIKSVETSNNPNSVDMSMDKITQAKNAAFQDTIIKEVGKLTTKLNEKKSKEEIQSSIDSINSLDKLSKMVGTQDVYNNKVKVNNKEITLKELSNLAIKKAQKQIAPKKVVGKQKEIKEPNKAVTGMKK